MSQEHRPLYSDPGLVEPRPSINSVLVADDDPIFRRVLQTWLQKWGHTVVVVEDGTEAWSALQRPGAPQMVVLDWMMPGMDGIELCRRLRDHADTYRYVLLITAKDDKQDVVAGLEAGADDYLTKPFDFDELHARVRAGMRILQLQDALLRAREKIQFEAAHDALTGIWNRRAILEFLQRETERQQRARGALGTIMADVDHFKRINDTYGHLAGDEVLREVTRRMVGAVRSYDYVGRYGGEEFLIVVPGCEMKAVWAGAERIRSAVADVPVELGGNKLSVTLSLGVASLDLAEGTTGAYEALLHAADLALYRAKENGRNRIEVSSELRAAARQGGR